jgi:hypothetical protein
MKIRPQSIRFAALLLLAFVLVTLFYPRERARQTEVVSSEAASKPRKSTGPLVSKPLPEDRVALLQVPCENPFQAAMLWSNTFPEQATRYAAVVSSANVPVYYFGLCVDQDEKPLAGVSVTLRVRQWQGISPIDLKGVALRFPKTSDASGRFELIGIKADVATVESATLPGYEWIRSGSPARDFTSSLDTPPSLADPVVLRFWKKLPSEPMYAAGPPLRQKIRCDGTPSVYDLKTGLPVAQAADASVQFSMQRDPVVMNASKTKQPSWKLIVEVPGGAVQLAATNMPFVAPTDGYVGQAVFGSVAGDAGWTSRTNTILYYRTSTGMYGRLEFDITATTDGPVAALNWNSFLNPSGSQVLEYDPVKRLKAAPAKPPSISPPPAPTQNRPAPFVPQPPPGFQALTNRAQQFTPPVPPRP